MTERLSTGTAELPSVEDLRKGMPHYVSDWAREIASEILVDIADERHDGGIHALARWVHALSQPGVPAQQPQGIVYAGGGDGTFNECDDPAPAQSVPGSVDKVATKTEQTYLALLLLPHNALRHRLQPELAACRDAIALSEDTEAEEIQTRYEAHAEKIRPLLWGLSFPSTDGSTPEPSR